MNKQNLLVPMAGAEIDEVGGETSEENTTTIEPSTDSAV